MSSGSNNLKVTSGNNIMVRRKVLLVLKVLFLFFLIHLISRISVKDGFSPKTEYGTKELLRQVKEEQFVNWRLYGEKFSPNEVGKLPDHATVRQQLAYQYPYEPLKPFPKNIWQTWKVGVEDVNFPPQYRKLEQSWLSLNPAYKHVMLPDELCHELVKEMYSAVPDVARAYRILPKSILKADFFRYLVLYARGGVYSDIDTKCLKPIDTWASMQKEVYGHVNNAGLVVGIESDPDRPDWAEWYARRIQFTQWTIQAKSGHPMLRELVARITEHTLERERKHKLKKVLGKDEGGDIMFWTGPGIWTDTVFDYLNNDIQPQKNFDRKKIETFVTWKAFTGLTSPHYIQDVIVLPITSFSPGVGHMNSQDSSHPLAYAEHTFLGSWKP